MKKLFLFFTMLTLLHGAFCAIKFTGGHINIPSGPVFTSTNALTVSLWVKAAKPTHPCYLLAKSIDKNGGSFAFYSGVNKGLQFYVTLDGVKILSPDIGQKIWDGKPHLIVGIYDGSMVKISVDNVDLGGTPGTGAITYNKNTMNIAMYDSLFYGGLFIGTLEDVRVWEMVVSTTSLNDLWTTKSNEETFEQPLAWWKLKEVPKGSSANGYSIIDEVGDSIGVSLGNAATGDDPLIADIPISSYPVTAYFLNQFQMNAVKERTWNDVFRKISNLDDHFFVGVATGDWAVNASTIATIWQVVNVDTITGVTCYSSTNTAHASWNDTFKLNLINALLADTWDDVTFPKSEFDFLDDARKASITQ